MSGKIYLIWKIQINCKKVLCRFAAGVYYEFLKPPRGRELMPRDGATILSDLIGKLRAVRVRWSGADVMVIIA
jgi:hypothetical protein